jgi:circadian clock protein KaiB
MFFAKPTHHLEMEKSSAARRRDSLKKTWRLRLYVRGDSPLCEPAIRNLRTICERCAPSSYELEVIDVTKDPDRLADEQIIALPTLVRLSPTPVRRLIGDLANEERVLIALELQAPSS